MALQLAPGTPEIVAILRERMEGLLEVCRSGGFANEQMNKLRLAEIYVEGVEMVGADDTVSGSLGCGEEKGRRRWGGVWQLNGRMSWFVG